MTEATPTGPAWRHSLGEPPTWFWIAIALGLALRLYLVLFTGGTLDVDVTADDLQLLDSSQLTCVAGARGTYVSDPMDSQTHPSLDIKEIGTGMTSGAIRPSDQAAAAC